MTYGQSIISRVTFVSGATGRSRVSKFPLSSNTSRFSTNPRWTLLTRSTDGTRLANRTLRKTAGVIPENSKGIEHISK